MHVFSFFSAGGVDQVVLGEGADLEHRAELDQKLWVALSCPTKGLEFDSTTLGLIDSDNDGQIRAPELLAATKWTVGLLRSSDAMIAGQPDLPLDAINTDTEEGAMIRSSAERILRDLGKSDATSITVEDTSNTAKIFAAMTFNGDGIVPADATHDGAVSAVIGEIIATQGGVEDRSGKPGVDQGRVDTFFADLNAFSTWWAQSESDASILPLGDATPGASAAFEAVSEKVEDWFTRCRLAAFDARSEGALNRPEGDYAALANRSLTLVDEELAGFPIARVEAGRSLPLDIGINPAWTAAIHAFRDAVVTPVLGEQPEIDEAQWREIKGKMAPFAAWSATAAGASVKGLGVTRVREILASTAAAGIASLVAQDKALEPQANAIAAVDRLVRYHSSLYQLLRNFTNFGDFYGGEKAIFQAGTLYLDHRSCELCLEVVDMGRHATLAAASQAFLAYCDVTRKSTGQKKTIVAAFTGGDTDNLIVGRNGVFYDRQGNDWHATITKIVANPISIRQAFWAPYKKVVKFIEDQMASFAASKEKDADAGVMGAAKSTAGGAPALPKAAFDVGKFAGIFAAVGLALGALGAAAAAIIGAFLGLVWWQMPIAIAAILLTISGPSMLVAWLKLRTRNLGPLLDANGWAINANTRVNVPFGESLTGVAHLPKGAKRVARDPFGESNTTRNLVLVAAILMFGVFGAWKAGALDRIIPAAEADQVAASVDAAADPVTLNEAAMKVAPPAE